MPKPPVPEDLPEEAVPCVAFVNTGGGTLPSRPGWAWLAGGLLHYRDEFMGFALQPDAVNDLDDLLVFECAEVNVPAGCPPITLGLSPAIEVDGEVVTWNPGDLPLTELCERWKASTPECEPLYPPIEPAPARKVAPWLVSALLNGLSWAAMLLVLEIALRFLVPSAAQRRPLGALWTLAPFLPLFGLAVIRVPQVALDLSWRKHRRREVDRLIEAS